MRYCVNPPENVEQALYEVAEEMWYSLGAPSVAPIVACTKLGPGMRRKGCSHKSVASKSRGVTRQPILHWVRGTMEYASG